MAGEDSKRRVEWEGGTSLALILAFWCLGGFVGFFGHNTDFHPSHVVFASMLAAALGISLSGIRHGNTSNRIASVVSFLLSLSFVLLFSYAVVTEVLIPRISS